MTRKKPTSIRSIFVACLLFSPALATASQIVVVEPTPGNPIQSGTDLKNALDGITGNAWGTRFVLQIEPGVYDLGDNNLQMKEWVDIAGSGRETTFILGNGNDATANIRRGLIEGADHAELRDLTIKVRSTPTRQFLVPIFLFEAATRITNVETRANASAVYCNGIYGIGYTSVISNVKIRSTCSGDAFGVVLEGQLLPAVGRPSIVGADVVARSTDPTKTATALLLGSFHLPSELRDGRFVATGGARAAGMQVGNGTFVLPLGSSLVVKTTTIVAENGAVWSRGIVWDSTVETHLVLEHSTIAASGSPSEEIGIFAPGSHQLSVLNGRVAGSTNTIVTLGPTQVASTRLNGGPALGGATPIACAGVYDENYVFFPNTCP